MSEELRFVTKTMITPVMNHIYIQPISQTETKGGIALPDIPSDDPGTRRGFVFAYSDRARLQMEETLGPELKCRFGEGCEVEYFGWSVTKVDGIEFHVVKPIDIWSILTEVEVEV